MPARRGEPTLDVAATADRERGRVWVHVVNRDPERPAAASIDLGGRTVGRVFAHTMAGPHPWARNAFGNKENVRIESRPVELSADGTYTFPACSATALEIELTL
jgi:alpha-L-arabinofuranosidase